MNILSSLLRRHFGVGGGGGGGGVGGGPVVAVATCRLFSQASTCVA